MGWLVLLLMYIGIAYIWGIETAVSTAILTIILFTLLQVLVFAGKQPAFGLLLLLALLVILLSFGVPAL
jgi:hypothetical protein